MTRTRPTTRFATNFGVLLALGGVLLLTGCAAGASTAAVPASSAAPASTGAPADAGINGTIASVAAGVLQVQDSSTQTAVSYTAATTITANVTGVLADVSVGRCVTVFGFAAASGTTAATAATSVSVTDAVDGACMTGIRGGGADGTMPTGAPGNGTMPTGAPDGTMPTDLPTDLPSGAAGAPGGGTFGFPVSGLVTAVTADSITVDAVGMGSTDTTSTAVTVASTTTYLNTVASDSSALVVGACAVATGASDTSGGFAATALTISTATADGCVSRSGFGGARPSGSTSNE
jgi:hypothetical protein